MRFILNIVLQFGTLEWLTVILVFLNLVTCALYVIDKRRAIKGKRRIRERTLLFFTIMCGGLGAFFGMRLARHKTKKSKFHFAVALGLFVMLVPVAHIVHGFVFGAAGC